MQRTAGHLGTLVEKQNASAHSLKNPYQTIDHLLRVIELHAQGEGVHTRATAAPVHPQTMGLPQTATTHPAAEAQPYRFTPKSFQTEVRRF